MKKFLSMVLAMVMTLSLATVSAGAKEFPDNDQLSGDADGVYAEAVNVLSEMGIIDGDTDGNFKPKGTLTRGAASKIIACMMLGKTTAESLGTAAAPFKDVPVGSTFAGYIAYCVEKGIIDGYADGTFRPSGALTGYAFQKMLLTALGYDSKIEGYANNPNWRVNVAGRAQQEGLLKGLDVSSYSAAEAATREQACLLALNTIKTPLVEYTSKGSTMTVNGAVIGQSASDAKYVTTVDRSRAEAIDDKVYQTSATGTSNSYFVEFGEQYQPDLRRVRTSDDFERPAYTWTWQKDEIGTYVNYDILLGEYNTGVTGRALRELIGQTAIDTSTLTYYVDGVQFDPEIDKYIDHLKIDGITKNTLVRSYETDAGMTKNGVLTQVFLDRDHGTPWKLTITSIDTWLAKANADYNQTAEELSLTAYTQKKGTDETVTKNLKVDVEDVPAIEGVKKDDFILIQRSGKDSTNASNPVLRVVDMADVEILSDSTVTQFSKGSKDGRAIDKLTTGGTEYNFSQKCYYDAEALEDYDRSLLTNMTYDVYLDIHGYVIGVSVHDGNRNYVFVTGYDFDGRDGTIINKTATAAAIFMDGSLQNITINSSDTDDNIDTYLKRSLVTTGATNYYSKWDRNGQAQHNRWYSYTVNAAGIYTLKPVERMLATDYTNPKGVTLDSVTLDSANLSLLSNIARETPKTVDGTTRAYGNDDSVYITVSTEKLSGKVTDEVISKVEGVYTGIQNVKMSVPYRDDFPEVYALYNSDNYVIAAVVVGKAQGSIDNYVYILDDAKSEKYEDGYYYWTFEAVQKGEKKTFTARSKYADTINKLDKYHVQQLLFDGDYVSRVDDINKDKFFVYNNDLLETYKEIVDIYDVGHVGNVYMDNCGDIQSGINSVHVDPIDNSISVEVVDAVFPEGTTGTSIKVANNRLLGTIQFIGNTLYVDPTDVVRYTDSNNGVQAATKNTDKGLAVLPSAKAVLIQEFNNERSVTEHSSVRNAIDSMRDADDSKSNMQFRGRIVAPLKDGVAQWVLIISDTPLKTGDPTGATTGSTVERNIYSIRPTVKDNRYSVVVDSSKTENATSPYSQLSLTGTIVTLKDNNSDLYIRIPVSSTLKGREVDIKWSLSVNGYPSATFVTGPTKVDTDGYLTFSSDNLSLKAGDKITLTIDSIRYVGNTTTPEQPDDGTLEVTGLDKKVTVTVPSSVSGVKSENIKARLNANNELVIFIDDVDSKYLTATVQVDVDGQKKNVSLNRNEAGQLEGTLKEPINSKSTVTITVTELKDATTVPAGTPGSDKVSSTVEANTELAIPNSSATVKVTDEIKGLQNNASFETGTNEDGTPTFSIPVDGNATTPLASAVVNVSVNGKSYKMKLAGLNNGKLEFSGFDDAAYTALSAADKKAVNDAIAAGTNVTYTISDPVTLTARLENPKRDNRTSWGDPAKDFNAAEIAAGIDVIAADAQTVTITYDAKKVIALTGTNLTTLTAQDQVQAGVMLPAPKKGDLKIKSAVSQARNYEIMAIDLINAKTDGTPGNAETDPQYVMIYIPIADVDSDNGTITPLADKTWTIPVQWTFSDDSTQVVTYTFTTKRGGETLSKEPSRSVPTSYTTALTNAGVTVTGSDNVTIAYSSATLENLFKGTTTEQAKLQALLPQEDTSAAPTKNAVWIPVSFNAPKDVNGRNPVRVSMEKNGVPVAESELNGDYGWTANGGALTEWVRIATLTPKSGVDMSTITSAAQWKDLSNYSGVDTREAGSTSYKLTWVFADNTTKVETFTISRSPSSTPAE